jgi:phosphatidylserine/phosphatidylglycerophosphate/cardiolipin synthase-like enzyme
VAAGLIAAIDAARHYVYVEDQTLNPSIVAGLYNRHRVLYPMFQAACARGVKVVFVTQGFSPEGIEVSDATPARSEEVWEWIVAELPPAQQGNFVMLYRRDTKVHSELMLIDDEFVAIGSANLWDRSLNGDESEVHTAIVHPGGATSLVADLRVRLWREHFGTPATPAADARLRDLQISMGYFRGTWGSGTAAEIPASALIRMQP